MVTIAPVIDNRPEAVSSAHWGDVSTTSFEATFLEATLKLLTIEVPARAIQDNPLSSITLISMDAEITQSQCNKSTHEVTRI